MATSARTTGCIKIGANLLNALSLHLRNQRNHKKKDLLNQSVLLTSFQKMILLQHLSHFSSNFADLDLVENQAKKGDPEVDPFCQDLLVPLALRICSESPLIPIPL